MPILSDVLSDAILDQLNQASTEWPVGPSSSPSAPKRKLSRFHGNGRRLFPIEGTIPEAPLPEIPLSSAELPSASSLPVPITSAPPAPPYKPPVTAIATGYPESSPRALPMPPTSSALSTNLRDVPPAREVDLAESARTAFRRDLAGMERRYGTQTFESLRQMNSQYNLGVDLSSARTPSLMERLSSKMHNLTGGRLGSEVSTMSYLDAYSQIQKGYASKLDDYIKTGQKSGAIGADASAVADATENDILRRRYMSQAKFEPAVKSSSVPALERGGKGLLGGKGKALGALVGVFALGGVIGNMLSGGHRSNAELYNPNGYQQYYS